MIRVISLRHLLKHLPENVKSDDSGILKVFYYFAMIQLHSEYIGNAIEYSMGFSDSHFVDLFYMFIDTCTPESKEMLQVQIEDEVAYLDLNGCLVDYSRIKEIFDT